MAIEILTDVIIPNRLWSKGVTGRLMRRNSRAQNLGGFMTINADWSNTLRQYTFGSVPLDKDDWASLAGLYEVSDAGTYGVLGQDPSDCSADHTTGVATLISAPAHTYQLKKRYTAAGSVQTRDRTIRHLKVAGFELKISGVTKVFGVDYTPAENTGVVTIPSDPVASTVTWSAIFYVPVHFRDDNLDWELTVAGSEDQRRFTGPTCVFDEVREQ